MQYMLLDIESFSKNLYDEAMSSHRNQEYTSKVLQYIENSAQVCENIEQWIILS